TTIVRLSTLLGKREQPKQSDLQDGQYDKVKPCRSQVTILNWLHPVPRCPADGNYPSAVLVQGHARGEFVQVGNNRSDHLLVTMKHAYLFSTTNPHNA
ncbi:12798_t:CDS:2, partial [Acaulospora morrowiae]